MAVNGTFYSVGVGPGDPELITLKAIRVIRECPVIYAPRTADGNMMALNIIKDTIDLSGKEIIPITFEMNRDVTKRAAQYRAMADGIEEKLKAGKSAALINIGDVSIYSTASYVFNVILADGYESEMVAGVPSFCAGAAALKISLCETTSPLHIIPAHGTPDADALKLKGTKVLMKSGASAGKLRDEIAAQGLLDKAYLFSDCGLESEYLCKDLSEVREDLSYFTTMIVKE